MGGELQFSNKEYVGLHTSTLFYLLFWQNFLQSGIIFFSTESFLSIEKSLDQLYLHINKVVETSTHTIQDEL